MKFKTLRKIDTKEFVHILTLTEISLFTGEMPNLMTVQTTMEDLIKYYGDGFSPIDLNIELVELDVIVENEIGADIRNKLTPVKNLVTMLKNAVFLRNGDVKMQAIIKKEIKKCEESIKYLTNLLECHHRYFSI